MYFYNFVFLSSVKVKGTMQSETRREALNQLTTMEVLIVSVVGSRSRWSQNYGCELFEKGERPHPGAASVVQGVRERCVGVR